MPSVRALAKDHLVLSAVLTSGRGNSPPLCFLVCFWKQLVYFFKLFFLFKGILGIFRMYICISFDKLHFS